MEDLMQLNELWAALVRAQARVKQVPKDSRNEFASFDYTSTEAIILEARQALAAESLAVISTEAKLVRGSEPDQDVVEETFALVHSSGQTLTFKRMWPVVPGKGRPLDRATASALTSNLGYFLRDLLLMPRVDATVEMDHTSRDVAENATDQEAWEERAQKAKEFFSTFGEIGLQRWQEELDKRRCDDYRKLPVDQRNSVVAAWRAKGGNMRKAYTDAVQQFAEFKTLAQEKLGDEQGRILAEEISQPFLTEDGKLDYSLKEDLLREIRKETKTLGEGEES